MRPAAIKSNHVVALPFRSPNGWQGLRTFAAHGPHQVKRKLAAPLTQLAGLAAVAEKDSMSIAALAREGTGRTMLTRKLKPLAKAGLIAIGFEGRLPGAHRRDHPQGKVAARPGASTLRERRQRSRTNSARTTGQPRTAASSSLSLHPRKGSYSNPFLNTGSALHSEVSRMMVPKSPTATHWVPSAATEARPPAPVE